MSDKYEVRQFKLASGEEIVCEIIQWNNEEELELVVRKAMKLVMGEMETGVRYYSFRPWMVYQENPDDFIVLNGNHVIGIGFPTDSLLKQYDEAVVEMDEMYKSREKEYKESLGDDYKSVDDINEMTRNLKKTSDEIEEYLESLKDKDSSTSNVITFNPKQIH